MDSEIVFLSITCPICQKVSAVPYEPNELIEALRSDKPFLLFSPCHARAWKATADDRNAMFELISTVVPPERIERARPPFN